MAYLVVREPHAVAYTQPLAGRLEAGREETNDLVLADGKASRRHARFEERADGWWITDLGSTHGTHVNRARTDEAPLHDGDRVQIGDVVLVFRPGQPPAEDTIYRTVDAGEPRGDADARRLRVLFDASRVIASGDDPDEIVAQMLASVLELLGCERAVAELVGSDGGGRRRIARARAGASADVVVSRAHIDAMLVRRESVLCGEPAGGAPETLRREGVRSAMGAPLAVARGVLGFLYADDRTRAVRFTPLDVDFLTAVAHLTAAAVEQAEQRRHAASVADALREAHPAVEMIGESAALRRLRAQLDKYAAAGGAPILIQGESGTGKELAAQTIHVRSPRADEPFVAVNCAAIPDTVLESELFGHERGAFTGALKARRGKFALAHRGTLFLDEIGDLSLAAQAKVLRAIEEGEIAPLGSERAQRVDVRVVSATHKRLEEEIAAGRFREDLYYRLALGVVDVPPLREREDDVLLLARGFLAEAARRVGRPPPSFSAEAVRRLRAARWPGNVRQLKNEVERAMILWEGGVEIDVGEPLGGATTSVVAPAASDELSATWSRLQREREAIDGSERRLVETALTRHEHVVARAARALGVPRTTLISRMEALGLATGRR